MSGGYPPGTALSATEFQRVGLPLQGQPRHDRHCTVLDSALYPHREARIQRHRLSESCVVRVDA